MSTKIYAPANSKGGAENHHEQYIYCLISWSHDSFGQDPGLVKLGNQELWGLAMLLPLIKCLISLNHNFLTCKVRRLSQCLPKVPFLSNKLHVVAL